MVKNKKNENGGQQDMNEIQRQVIEETAEAEKRRRETHEALKAWATGETSLYDESGKKIAGV